MAKSMNSASASNTYEPTLNPRFSILENKIPIDASSGSHILVSRRSPNSKGSPYINSNGVTYFETSSDSSIFHDLSAYSLLIKCHAENELGAAVDHENFGTSWNPIAELIATVNLRFNSSSTSIEIDTSNLMGHANMVRTLVENSASQLESMEASLWTPVFESDAERDALLSNECLARTAAWWSSPNDDIIYNTRLIPLSLLFSSCNTNALLNLSKVELYITWRDPTTVGFSTAADKLLHTNYVYVDDCQLIVNQTQMSMTQSIIETSDMAKGKNVQNLMFPVYESFSVNYTSSSHIIRNSVTNLDSAFLMFPANILPKNINQYQYTSNSISNYSAIYNNLQVPTTPIANSIYDKKCNVEQFYEMLRCCDRINSKNWTHIPFLTAYANEAVSNDYADETYFVYATKFNLGTSAPKLISSSELRLIPIQSSTNDPEYDNTNCTCIVVLKRWQQISIMPDGTIVKNFQ